MKKNVVGLGEVLWDIFPERTCLGGAPANFAYMTTLLGDEGIVASRIGNDSRGVDAIRHLKELGVNTSQVQTDHQHPTGVVNVKIDGQGFAQYEIAHPVAWDFLEWTSGWQHLAESADAVCFGSLAQRSEKARSSIRRFLAIMSEAALKIFDVNLRQSYYSAEILSDSMKLADIVKVNDEELPRIMGLSRLPHKDEMSSAQRLRLAFGLKLICVTRGGRGSLLVSDREFHEHPGFRVHVADTVGAGDAFTAGLVHEYLHGASLAVMNEAANRLGTWVASQAGGMPVPKRGGLKESLAEIG